MDTVIYRKPSIKFELTFEEVLNKIMSGLEELKNNQNNNQNSNQNNNQSNNTEATTDTGASQPSIISMKFVCETFPKNSFMCVSTDGTFHLYHIRNDSKIIYGTKCIAGTQMFSSKWAVAQRVDDIFYVFDFDTGNTFELSELRQKVIEENKNGTYQKPQRKKNTRRYNNQYKNNKRSYNSGRKFHPTNTNEENQNTQS